MTIAWIDANWPAPENVVAGTTLRHHGVSTGPYASLNLAEHIDDDVAAVAENRRRFVVESGLPSEPVWLQQNHGVNVSLEAPQEIDVGSDALVSREPERVCVVLTADCLPVVFASRKTSEVAIAHAGWRGLCAGILEATVARMAACPTDILAWLGPAISQPAFEVGEEVREQFMRQYSGAVRHFRINGRGRYQADLYGLARQRLAEVGVTEVYGGDRCTHAESNEFFSYRRDGQCGRMATFVYRRQGSAK